MLFNLKCDFHPTAGTGNVSYVAGKSYNRRLYHYNYLKEHYRDYGGVILGGSKGMRVSEELLSELSGTPCRNLTAEVGNFSDYLSWVRWLIGHTDIKLIFINLSTLEVDYYSEKERGVDTSGYYMPAALDKEKNKLTEFVQYLYRGGIQTSIDYLRGKRDGTLPVYSMEDINENDMYVQTEARKLNPQALIDGVNAGLADRLEDAAQGRHSKMPAIERNLLAMKEIKKLCKDAGVELKVVFASTYIGQYLLYESPEYWEYLMDLAQITDYWDFSFLNSYNRNPYNFMDSGHAYADTLNHMLKQIYGKEDLEDFGVYVTADNVDSHIKKRKQRFYSLIHEYKKTGEVRLDTAYGDGSLVDDYIFPVVTNMASPQTSAITLGDHLFVAQHFYAAFGQMQGVGIFADGLAENEEERGVLCLKLYDDTAKHTRYTAAIETEKMKNGKETVIRFPDIELVEGHWYSLIFSYEPTTADHTFGLMAVDGPPDSQIYAELDGEPFAQVVKMNIYGCQECGMSNTTQNKLLDDQMRGEGEGHTNSISKNNRYVQYFKTDGGLLSYIQIQTFRKKEEEPAEDESYQVVFELRDSKGMLMGKRTVMGMLLQNADTFCVVLDGMINLKEGEVYELTIYSEQTPKQGLMLMTHAADETRGSVLYQNGKKTDDSLCYRIYRADGEKVEVLKGGRDGVKQED